MVDPETDAIAVAVGIAPAIRGIDEAGPVVPIGHLIGGLFHRPFGAVVEIVPFQFHLVVEKVEGAVHTAHPGRGDTVSAAESATAPAHAASAAAHALHHAAGQIIESPVVGIVPVQDDADLAFVGELARKGGTLETIVPLARIRSRHVMTATQHHIPERTLFHARMERQIDDGLLVSVVNPRKLGLLRFLVHHLQLLDGFGGDILGCQLRIVQEEGLSVNGYLADGLAIGGNGTVLPYFNTREFLQEVFQHVVVGSLERGSVILYRIFLDDDGIAGSAYRSGVQHLTVGFHLQHAQIHVPLNVYLPGNGFVPQDFRLERVGTRAYLLQDRSAFVVRQGVFLGLVRTRLG